MPTPTYDLIASNVLTSSASSVTFSSIPQTYRDLIIISTATTSTSAFIRINLNGATTGYTANTMTGNGSSIAADTWTDDKLCRYAFTDTATAAQFITQIFDYSTTDKHKSLLSRASNSSRAVESSAIRYASTAAITSVVIKSDSSFLAGSTFYLYGIVS